MKLSALVFVLVVAVALAEVSVVAVARDVDEDGEKIEYNLYPDIADCILKTGFSGVNWRDAYQSLQAPMLNKSQEERCFYGCLLRKYRVINEEGSISQEYSDNLDVYINANVGQYETMDKAKESIERAKLANAKCATSVPPNKDPCVMGPALQQCWQKEKKTLCPVTWYKGIMCNSGVVY